MLPISHDKRANNNFCVAESSPTYTVFCSQLNNPEVHNWNFISLGWWTRSDLPCPCQTEFAEVWTKTSLCFSFPSKYPSNLDHVARTGTGQKENAQNCHMCCTLPQSWKFLLTDMPSWIREKVPKSNCNLSSHEAI